jgi:hypothetical protein
VQKRTYYDFLTRIATEPLTFRGAHPQIGAEPS